MRYASIRIDRITRQAICLVGTLLAIALSIWLIFGPSAVNTAGSSHEDKSEAFASVDEYEIVKNEHVQSEQAVEQIESLEATTEGVMSYEEDESEQVKGTHTEFKESSSDISGSSSEDIDTGEKTAESDEAALNAPDVGGELAAQDSDYDGELAVPDNISLERPVISEGVMCMPLKYATVSSLFGYRQNPVTGRYTFHSGYDLAAPTGSEICSMFDGTVTTAAWDDGYGNYVVVTHNSMQTLYAHCSQLLVSRGDIVSAGDKIALVGSTGNSTGAHLHVEVRIAGKRYDPEWLLGGIYS